jgi:anti-sigma factor ChrR (cupin superfamily)
MLTAESPTRQIYGAIENVNSANLEWLPVAGAPGNYLKVLTLDEKNHRVDFLFKMDPGAEFTTHTHLCTAVAYTLEGKWGYREGDDVSTPGHFSYEPPGTRHTPYSIDGMVVYASFQGTSNTMLELYGPDDSVVGYIGLDFFKDYYRA